MSKGYLVFRKGEFYGILENKEEYKLIQEQRDCKNYDFVKMNWDKINKSVEGYDIGYYSAIYREGFIMFPHEEVGLMEQVASELESGMELVMESYKIFNEYVKFDDNELKLLNAFSLITSKIFYDEMNNGIYFDNPESSLDVRGAVHTWVVMIDDGED